MGPCDPVCWKRWPYAEWGLRDLSIVGAFNAFFTFVSNVVAWSEEASGSGCHALSSCFPMAEWPLGPLYSMAALHPHPLLLGWPEKA